MCCPENHAGPHWNINIVDLHRRQYMV
jgi:hypothetical protein